MALYSQLLSQAQGVAATPYTPYTGQLVAPVNAQQSQGIAGINSAASFGQPYIQQALGLAGQAAQPITAQQIQQYQNPYTQQVVQATQNQFNNQNAQQQQQVLGNAAMQGALGGNRVGLTQAALAGQQQLAQAPVIANLMSQGYTTGVNTALQEQQAGLAGAYGVGGLGVAGQNAGLTGANAQIGAGTLQQQTQQAQDTAQYQQFLNQMGYPFQTTQWLAGLGTGVGSQMGGTSSGQTTSPGPNTGSQILGGATAALGFLGMFSDRRVKENIKSIGKLNDGQVIYRFNYKGDPTTHIGLIAQEVEKHHPEAVGSYNGVKTVDYKEATKDASRARGGGIEGVAGFDSGGGVGVANTPYAGGTSYVPGLNITGGRGAPDAKAPNPAGQPGSSGNLGDQFSKLGGLAKQIYQGINAPMNINPSGDFSATPVGGFSSTGEGGWSPLEGVGSAAAIWSRGGAVNGYADGGAPTFDERFAGAPDDSPPSVPGLDATAGGYSPMDSGYLNEGLALPASKGFASLDQLPQGGADGAPTPAMVPTPSGQPAPTVPEQREEGLAPTPVSLTPDAGGTAPAASTPSAGVAASGVPRGIRNNNPGNIEDGPFARSQPGYSGSDGRFAIFNTPDAGQAAAGNLLRNYGNKGINTVSGIINRWAPAADNNNTAAYIAAVSKATGFAPNQPLDMNDPAVTQKLASAIGAFENGTGGPTREFMNRVNYNRSASLGPAVQGVAASEMPSNVGDTTELSAESKKPGFLSNIDLSNNSKLWPSLINAGFGMMSSRSPFFGTAVGEGGLTGMQTYSALSRQEQANALAQQKLDQNARKLSQDLDLKQRELGVKMMPYSNMTAAQKLTAQNNQERMAELKRQHDLQLKTPVKIGVRRDGTEMYAIPRPGADGRVEYYPIDPKTMQVSPVPLGNQLTPGAQPGQQPLNPNAPQSGGQPPGTANAQYIQTAAEDPLDRAQQSAPPPEARATMPPGSKEARNDAYLQELAKDDPKYAALLKGIADYQLNPNQLFSLRGNRRERAMSDLFVYDPTYDQRRFAQTNRGIVGWTQSPEGRSTRAMNVVIEHLGTAEELGKALDNGKIQVLNNLRNTLRTQFGDAAVPNFEFAKQIVADEIAKGVIGGVNAASDREGLQAQLKAASSPAQLAGVIKTAKELMGGQLVGLQKSYEFATGLHNFNDQFTPRTQLAVSQLMAEREAKLAKEAPLRTPGAGGGNGAGAPAAPAAPERRTQNGWIYEKQQDGSFKAVGKAPQ